MKKLLTMGALILAGCSQTGAGEYDYSDGGGGGGGGVPSGGGNGSGGVGLLTAGELDDNANFDYFQRIIGEAFAAVAQLAELSSADRISLTVLDPAERPVSNAVVRLVWGDAVKGTFLTGSDGRVLLFPGLDGFSVTELSLHLTAGGVTTVVAPGEGRQWRYEVPSSSPAPQQLDLAFAIDATGSMGDELSFLHDEVQAIVERTRERFPGVSVRYGFVIYRDEGDDFVTRSFPFSAELPAFQAALARYQAGGGGDYPEAADAALEASLQLGWREGNVARVLFHIADAPAHARNYRRFLAAANAMRPLGVRLYPIAASGTSKEAEYLMRSAALLTLGRYLFLTDDSGIGAPHEEPTIPCYQVQHLDDLLVRTLASELSGEYVPAAAADVLRTVGTYEARACAIAAPAPR